MTGRPSAAIVEAMQMVLAGVTPYTASKRTGITTNTMYRSRLYKFWKDGTEASMRQLRDEMMSASAVPRAPKKPARFGKDRAKGKS